LFYISKQKYVEKSRKMHEIPPKKHVKNCPIIIITYKGTKTQLAGGGCDPKTYNFTGHTPKQQAVDKLALT
jgi:hypothetical protein